MGVCVCVHVCDAHLTHPLPSPLPQRCMRFLPHHSDTGGFFVAVLEKVGDCGRVPFPESWAALDKRKRRRSEGAKEVRGRGGGEMEVM